MTALIFSIGALLSALASSLRARAVNKKVDTRLEDCEVARDKLRHDLRAVQADRDDLRIRTSALETQIVMLQRLLPEGDIARRLRLYDTDKPG